MSKNIKKNLQNLKNIDSITKFFQSKEKRIIEHLKRDKSKWFVNVPSISLTEILK